LIARAMSVQSSSIKLSGDSSSKVDGINLALNSSVMLGFQCAPLAEGVNNTYLGFETAQFVTVGDNNTGIGYQTCQFVSGNDNTFIGMKCAAGVFDSSDNVFVGSDTGSSQTGGGRNVLLGASANVTSGNTVASVAIGQGASAGHVNATSVGTGAAARGEDATAVGAGVIARGAGSFNIANRLTGRYVGSGTTVMDTYTVQTECDVLSLAGAALAMCHRPLTGGTNADPSWVFQLTPSRVVGSGGGGGAPVFSDLELRSKNKAVVRFTDEFTPGVLNFTGQHRCAWDETLPRADAMDASLLHGCIVVATGAYRGLDGSISPTIDEAIPVVRLCRRARDQRVFGVIAAFERDDGGDGEHQFRVGHMSFSVPRSPSDPSARVLVNAVGEGAIWVCSAGGPIRNGDLIEASPIPGMGMRQRSRAVLSSTVAKVTCDCGFGVPGLPTSPGIAVVMDDDASWPFGSSTSSTAHVARALLGCSYRC
jgi:hypothetical protein